MDPEPMEDDLLDSGKELTEKLLRSGFEIVVTFWLRRTTNGKWYFYIVSPAVDKEGKSDAYMRLHPLLLAAPKRFLISIFRTNLIGTQDPIAKDILAYHSHAEDNLVVRPLSLAWQESWQNQHRWRFHL